MKKILSCISIALLQLAFTSNAEDNDKQLVFASTYIRHGDRAPYAKADTPKFTYQWPMGIGELTPLGMHQEFELGKKLRTRYVDTLHLLPPAYQNSTIYVLSTDYSRTIQSAESLLLGLYPQGTGPKLDDGNAALPYLFQPIPVHTIPAGQPNIVRPEQYDPEQFKWLMDNYSHTQKQWNDINDKLFTDSMRWEKTLGKEIDSFDDFLVLADNLKCMSLHNIALPEGLTKQDLDSILKASERLTALQYDPAPVARFMAAGFLNQLKKDMLEAVADKQVYKFKLYSGHDTAMCGIMSAIGKPLQLNPPYASHVNFELYRKGSSYTVSVVYNGETLLWGTDVKSDCLALDEFVRLIDSVSEAK